VSDLTLLDRHGQPLQTLRVDMTVRRLPWVPLDQMSPALLQAVVHQRGQALLAAQRRGLGGRGAQRLGNLLNTRTRGASTLTMQLAGPDRRRPGAPAQGRSVVQKLGQVVVAAQLERSWTKSQILEAYLNSVPWRGEVVGINALAQTLFGKHASGLDLDEAAIAAALVRGPNASPDRGGRTCLRRAAGPEADLRRRAHAGRAGAAAAPGRMLGEQLAPHYARLALQRDGPAQQAAAWTPGCSAWRCRRCASSWPSCRAATSKTAPWWCWTTPAARCWPGWGPTATAQRAAQVDGVLARRQPGSTLKPFRLRPGLRAAADHAGQPARRFTRRDRHRRRAVPAAELRPRYKGLVSARTALGASLNVPAVRVAGLLPPDALHARLNALGLDLKESGGWYGASLALGSAEVTLLAPGQRLPHAGQRRAVHTGGAAGPAGRAARRVADARRQLLVADILADNNARVRTFGLDSHLRTRGWAAVKTGTSKDLRDNWCVGFTDRYTVGVWVGNASGAPMHDVSGISGAAPVWQALVSSCIVRCPRGRRCRRPACRPRARCSTATARPRATNGSSPAPRRARR
jgi:penicillin-binding protein 1C